MTRAEAVLGAVAAALLLLACEVAPATPAPPAPEVSGPAAPEVSDGGAEASDSTEEPPGDEDVGPEDLAAPELDAPAPVDAGADPAEVDAGGDEIDVEEPCPPMPKPADRIEPGPWCQNDADLAVFAATAAADFEQISTTCGASCFAVRSCIAQCLHAKLGLTCGCAGCFAYPMSCVMAYCFGECPGDACKSCGFEHGCWMDFVPCVGAQPVFGGGG